MSDYRSDGNGRIYHAQTDEQVADLNNRLVATVTTDGVFDHPAGTELRAQFANYPSSLADDPEDTITYGANGETKTVPLDEWTAYVYEGDIKLQRPPASE